MIRFDSKLAKKEYVSQEKATNHPNLLTPIPEPYYMAPDKFKVSTDSGAHTLYKQKFIDGKATEAARLNADYSYTKSKEFKTFLDKYIKHILDNKHLYDFVVTLDIINNPQESWNITEYIESCGLKPIPVFHNGEDIQWLHKMLDRYDYIGISGLGQDITKPKFYRFGDACFDAICDKHGVPRAKIHGFAMGSPDILQQYPWYSADQSTWTYMSRVGSLLVPRPIIKNSQIVGFDYTKRYKVLPVTDRRQFEKHHLVHVQGKNNKFWLETYMEMMNFSLEEASNYYHVRDIANIRLFDNIQKQTKQSYKTRYGYEEGANILFAGTPAGASTNLTKLIRLLYDVNIESIHWLVTPIYGKFQRNCLDIKTKSLENQPFNELCQMISEPDPEPETEPEPSKKIKRITPPIKSYDCTVTITLTTTAFTPENAEVRINTLLNSTLKPHLQKVEFNDITCLTPSTPETSSTQESLDFFEL